MSLYKLCFFYKVGKDTLKNVSKQYSIFQIIPLKSNPIPILYCRIKPIYLRCIILNDVANHSIFLKKVNSKNYLLSCTFSGIEKK
jgi:hypothetical protein